MINYSLIYWWYWIFCSGKTKTSLWKSD